MASKHRRIAERTSGDEDCGLTALLMGKLLAAMIRENVLSRDVVETLIKDVDGTLPKSAVRARRELLLMCHVVRDALAVR